MLTLQRKEGESIIIQKDDVQIVITITNISGKRAKISFDAPEEYKILREEILQV